MIPIKTKILIAAVFLLAALTAGCTDDLIIGPDAMPEGSTRVQVELDFTPFAGREVRSFHDNPSGSTMSGIDDLVVLIYDSEGNLLPDDRGMIRFAADEIDITYVPRTDADASNGISAEKSTARATFGLDLDYGLYYIYALANIGRIKDGVRASSLDELRENHRDEIATVEGLLGIQVAWDTATLRNNCQMLGVFTDGRASSPSTPGDMSLDSNPNYRRIAINRPGMKCHAWLRRCASKITVDFDGSGLMENTRVYFKQATVHDIAASCRLGTRNQVTDPSGLITNRKGDYGDGKEHPDYRPAGGTRIMYCRKGDEERPEAWPYVSRGINDMKEIVNDAGITVSDYHSEDAPALYLFENMQGDGEPGINDKETSPADGSDTVEGADEIKDNMPLGSYIEVEGYYDYHTSQHVSKGKIYYRFMLGSDTRINFDTERNHHYRLTLKVRGKGNDYDWHIEYDEQDGFDIRDPYFVSYLYNHSSTIPFKYVPSDPRLEVYRLDAEIVGNNWWPDGSPSYAAAVVAAQNPRAGGVHYGLDDDFTLNLTASDLSGVKRSRFLGNGFLSLRKTAETNLTTDITGEASAPGQTWVQIEANKSLNDAYFFGTRGGVDRSRRTYLFDGSDPTNTGVESYTMTVDPATGGYEFNIPMYTRAKTLVKKTGYTGNNPFTGHTRTAFVRLTVYLRDKVTKADYGTDSQIVRVEQVKRVVNPKGIYRSAGNNEPFHVRLMELEGDNATVFNVIRSRGPWMAEVIGSDDFIKLNGRHKVIRGSTDSPVDFNINFNRMNVGGKVRNAIVRVRYNNYTCVHLIFVRQGYKPQELAGIKWRISNLRHAGLSDVDFDPRDEGSLFKRANTDDAIHPVSNTYGSCGYPSSFPTWQQSVRLATASGEPEKSAVAWGSFDGENKDFDLPGMVTMADFDRLYMGKNIEFGFGVLYADGATETADNIDDAYGFYYGDVDGGDGLGATRGMRGVFAYYWNPLSGTDGSDAYLADPMNCRNIFFPIGRSGYGHRRTNDTYNATGILRYSCGRTGEFPSNLLPWMPLFFDLYKRYGAIYWAKDCVTDGIHDVGTGKPIADNDNGTGLDINFFTYDVNYISISNLFKTTNATALSDACFIRLKEE